MEFKILWRCRMGSWRCWKKLCRIGQPYPFNWACTGFIVERFFLHLFV